MIATTEYSKSDPIQPISFGPLSTNKVNMKIKYQNRESEILSRGSRRINTAFLPFLMALARKK
ncbi:hypothetical Protein YC6258_01445 [Gynuella sunshinyii YC6258]|uniref:Uncharacterized protein n=1 Tax=Gynuella sunshinyii YC6258 TaxID=1445510 RepID=A0A0C5VJB9_9GAMM|nr:hypothetical Protein YC6258_01445 [Gynuella sunshinyii YC6258]